MKVIGMIEKYLLEHSFDGLFHADSCCGCDLGDLIPCGEPSPNCEAGYAGEGSCECGGDCIAGIWREKPEIPWKEDSSGSGGR